MSKVTPWLWFDTEAEEAANFYVSLFPNSKVTDVSRYGPGGPRPEGDRDDRQLRPRRAALVGLNGGPEFKFNEAVSFSVSCEGQDEVDAYWSKLTADGGEEGPCGWLKDKYGVSWQIVPRRSPGCSATRTRSGRSGPCRR